MLSVLCFQTYLLGYPKRCSLCPVSWNVWLKNPSEYGSHYGVGHPQVGEPKLAKNGAPLLRCEECAYATYVQEKRTLHSVRHRTEPVGACTRCGIVLLAQQLKGHVCSMLKARVRAVEDGYQLYHVVNLW